MISLYFRMSVEKCQKEKNGYKMCIRDSYIDPKTKKPKLFIHFDFLFLYSVKGYFTDLGHILVKMRAYSQIFILYNRIHIIRGIRISLTLSCADK